MTTVEEHDYCPGWKTFSMHGPEVPCKQSWNDMWRAKDGREVGDAEARYGTQYRQHRSRCGALLGGRIIDDS